MSARLLERIDQLRATALADVARAKDLAQAEACRIRYLGRKGELTALLQGLKEVDPVDRPLVGKGVNALKNELELQITDLLATFKKSVQTNTMAREHADVTVPGRKIPVGHLHPLRQVMDNVIDCFVGLGFSVCEGPEIETDYYNFEALGIPADHPARDMQDTFYVAGGSRLRTHTSPVQIRVMEKEKPPIAMIAPGTVYRRDDDVTHSPMFHQVEGLMVDERVTMGDLKGTLALFCRRIFGAQTPVRFRPSYFPFTEPSAEVDIGCILCKHKGCRVCKGTGWLEIMGCGMVDPVVFRSVKIDPKKFSGFAFGMGIERIAMLTYGINDIRLFFENDLRFLEQF